MANNTYSKSSYDRGGSKYGAKDPRGIASGQPFITHKSPHLNVPKTTVKPTANDVDKQTGGQNRYRMRNPNRPMQQNAYKTISSPAVGKTKDWQTRGDKRKHTMAARAYSMNQVSVAKIMKGNVNANEGAYMKRGGDRQV